ncbi:MAG: hypothetical protein QOF73_404 [Thermomicrobiales bacterium]|jgi:hypothetical protein|nr:hypothetical protein [Thermomicrobiales bacterium]
MNDAGAFVGIALGVLVAVLYPILRGYIKKEFVALAGPGLPPWVKKYAALFFFCLITAFIALAVIRSSSDAKIAFWQAVMIGLGWEAVVEKAFAKPI